MLGSQILDLKILGNDLYYIVNSFWIYSFFGWIWESSFVSVKKRKLVNRGFVTGPVLTLYGFGAVLVYMFLHPFSNHILTLFFWRHACSYYFGVHHRSTDESFISHKMVGLQ